MEHRESRNQPSTEGLYLIPVNGEWWEQFRASVEQPHDLRQYTDVPPQLEGYDELRIWGTTETESTKKQSAIDQMQPEDCILFYHSGEFIAGAQVQRTFENPDVGVVLWDEPKSRHVFTLHDFTTEVPPIEQVWEWLGYDGRQVVEGFTRVQDDRLARVKAEFGSVQKALFGAEREPTEVEIRNEQSALVEALEQPPELTDDQVEYKQSQRRARDAAFGRFVKETYGGQCAFCGSKRETPKGDPEVEAAHIYPKEESGSDDVRNGVALCKLHHWAFDVGWLSISDEHRLLVKEAPERNGYSEFKQLEGNQMRLPEESALMPDSLFLNEHRRLHEFSDD